MVSHTCRFYRASRPLSQQSRRHTGSYCFVYVSAIANGNGSQHNEEAGCALNGKYNVEVSREASAKCCTRREGHEKSR